MRYRMIAFLLSISFVSGCGNLKLLAPEHFGLVPLAHNIYVEGGADGATRDTLCDAVTKAETAIRATYAGVSVKPTVYACISEDCYESFGGKGSRAKVYGDRILISPRGLNWHFIAHEWSHAEMSTRLTWVAWLRMPQWFDEGLAVAVSEAPEHSESQWKFIVASHIPYPRRDELLTFKSLRDWIDAVHDYGKKSQNAERRAKGETEVRSVYAAAGHEVRPWLAKVGSQGLLAFIGRLNDGEVFESAYVETANKALQPTAQPLRDFASAER